MSTLRRFSFVVVYLLVFSLPCLAEDKSAEQEAKRHKLELERILNMLHTTKVSVDFKETPFEECIDFFRKMTKLNIVIDPKVHEKYPSEDMKVTLKVDELKLYSVFKIILRFWDLRMLYKDGVLFITTQEEVAKRVRLRIYDVRDLVVPLQDFPGPSITLPATDEGEDPLSGVVWDWGDDPNVVAEPDELVNMIRTHIDPESWENTEGASVTISNGLLIVVASDEVHEKIALLLAQLRAMR